MKNKHTLSHRKQEPENGVLYIVGTPIGNLLDISPRAINILKNVSLIACEDTRQTMKIISKFNFNNKLISFNKNNSYRKIPEIIGILSSDKSVALVSDAGMPSICDPGEDLVKQARANCKDIICIPGPCAATTALVTSGMQASRFSFEGFLPKKKIEREKILKEISTNKKTTVLYESPHRINKLLRELREYCGEEREIQLSRELTKKFEENICCSIKEVIDFFDGREIIGEITIVIKGVDETMDIEINKIKLRKELLELIDAGLTLSAASKFLAKKKNIKKSIIYNLY